MKLLGYIEDRWLKIAMLGAVLLGTSWVGFCVGSISGYYAREPIIKTEHTAIAEGTLGRWVLLPYDYDYSLETPSTILLYLGLTMLCPALIRLSVRLLQWLWKAVLRMIYEAVYVATSASKDAKKEEEGSGDGK